MFEVAVKEAVERLREVQKAGQISGFALIGGLAVSRLSTPRATSDVDFIIRSTQANLKNIAKSVGGISHLGDVDDPLMGSVSFQIVDELGPVPIQLVLFPPALQNDVFERVAEQDVGGIVIPFADWTSLVLMKLYAGAPHDLKDAQDLIAVNSGAPEELSALMARAKKMRLDRKLAKVIGSASKSG